MTDRPPTRRASQRRVPAHLPGDPRRRDRPGPRPLLGVAGAACRRSASSPACSEGSSSSMPASVTSEQVPDGDPTASARSAWLRYLDLGRAGARASDLPGHRPAAARLGRRRRSGGSSSALIRDVARTSAPAASKDPRTVAGLLTASHDRTRLARLRLPSSAPGWLSGRRGFPQRSSSSSCSPLYFTVNMVLRPFETPMSAWLKGLSTKQKLLLRRRHLPRHHAPAVRRRRQRRKERRVQAAERVQARPVDLDQDRRARPVDQPGGALPVPRRRADRVHDDLHRPPHAASARTASRPRSRPPTASCATTSPRGT